MTTNPYFDAPNWARLARNTLARAEAVNAIVDAVVTGFGYLPTYQDFYNGKVSFAGSDTGVANIYVVTLPYAASVSNGLTVRWKIGQSNSGPSTLAVYKTNPDTTTSLLGTFTIKNYAGAVLTGGELPAGGWVDTVYDSSDLSMRIINPKVAIGTVTVNNLVKVSPNDTTPGTLSQKIQINGAVPTITNPGANEIINFVQDEGGGALIAEAML